MLKYVDVKEVFAEIPDEITLAISISQCPLRCKGCHSQYLWEDIGDELNTESLSALAWYSGRDTISPQIHLQNLDYIKIGRYDEKQGPLNKQETNQILYKVEQSVGGESVLTDITHRFWKRS